MRAMETAAKAVDAMHNMSQAILQQQQLQTLDRQQAAQQQESSSSSWRTPHYEHPPKYEACILFLCTTNRSLCVPGPNVAAVEVRSHKPRLFEPIQGCCLGHIIRFCGYERRMLPSYVDETITLQNRKHFINL